MVLTIKDIARMAGVSVSAVSKCINNYPDIGKATRKKIIGIMEQTGFKPSFSAKSLISKRTHMIGVIFGHEVHYDFNHIYFTEILNTFKDAIGQQGYDILLFSNRVAHEEGDDYLSRCIHYNVDGCLVFAASGVWEAVQKLDRSEIPCVGIDLNLRGNHSASVRVDNVTVGRLAAEHLLSHGHRHIGYIGSKHAEPIYKNRESGFRTALSEAGIAVQEEWILYTGNHLEQDGYDAAMELLQRSELPTALFVGSDLLATGAVRAFKEAGLQLPDDMSMIGCDNIYSGRYIEPPLTTVNQDKDSVGRQAAELMHQLIQLRLESTEASAKRADGPIRVMIQPSVVVRSSVQAYRSGLQTKRMLKSGRYAGMTEPSARSARIEHQRRTVLELAETLGSITKACEQTGMSRTQFYEYKRRFEEKGLDGLKNVTPPRKVHPQAKSHEAVELLLSISLDHPAWGCSRLSQELEALGHEMSAPTVQKLLNKHSLGTRQDRLLALEKRLLLEPDRVSAELAAELERANPCLRERHADHAAPGELLVQDTWLAGHVAGIGKVYVYCAVDAYASYAFASLSVQKRPEQAAALLHEEALPFYQYMELPVGELLTGSGSDYGGSGKLAHPFSLYAALHGIPQRLAEGQAAHANGYMERFKQTAIQAFFRRSDSSAAYDLLESLQLEFADWLAAYNTERPHYGYPNDGKPPLERITSYLAQRPKAH